jgi:gliding motility-associated lipoprotein GldJ
MKVKTIAKLSVILLFAFVFTACNKSQTSRTTGWKYGDSNGTGFSVGATQKSKTPRGMVAIEGGSFTIGEKGEYVTAPRNNQRRRITVSSFYMDQYEIRNVDWREYMHWMKLVFEKTAPLLVAKASPDNTVWREELAYNEPLLQYYFSHPSFNEYPIVGISWEQAMDYSAWRTDRVNEMALINAGIITPPDFKSAESMDYQTVINDFVFNTQKYLWQGNYQPQAGSNAKKDFFGQNRKVNMADGIMVPDFRLPTEAEWEFAAYAVKAEKDGFTTEGKIYPWKGHSVRNPTKKQRGQMMANFVRGRGDMMGTSGRLNDRATIPNRVDAYYPNDFGLYNMAGNVNEWVLDVYRSTTFDDMAEYNSFRGNIYTAPIAVSKDEFGSDVFGIDSLGRVAMGVIPSGDVRNFKDGDPISQIETDFPLFADEGIENLTTERKLDPTDVLSPKISDKTRVYKGGSWKDRIYWLNPSTRRYLDQDKSTNDIGFRCAMSMIGDEGVTEK